MIFTSGTMLYPLVLAASTVLALGFLIYVINCAFLIRSSRRYICPDVVDYDESSSLPGQHRRQKPSVAIHLPIYNERYVAERLIGSCARLADVYGRDIVRIMVLDDSDDDTMEEVTRVADDFRTRGYRVEVVHRNNRVGFKAGALQNALDLTSEDYVAIFDSDFMPLSDFLDRTIPFLEGDRKLAVAQVRWSHVNRDYNELTRAISLGMDAHFFVEQPGRFSANCFLNFNGSGGAIRTSALREAGGWLSDTLAEDLDASYRIQLKGYRILFLRDVQAPGEVPPTITSFKRQQNRWASGSLQTAKKTLPQLLRSRDVSAKQKVEAVLHLTYYLVHPLMFLSFALAVFAVFSGVQYMDSSSIVSVMYQSLATGNASLILGCLGHLIATFPALALLVVSAGASTLVVWTFYLIVLRMQKMSIIRNIKHVLILGLIGYGISASNSIATLRAIASKKSGAFRRTPKYAIVSEADDWRSKKYQVPLDYSFLLELISAAVGILAIAFAFEWKIFGLAVLLLPYSVGFLYVAFLSATQSRSEKLPG